MTKDEALKLALEYVEIVPDDRYNAEHIDREALVTAIKEAFAQPERDYERGFIDGMQKQMQSSVDKAVNAMTQRTWVGLTDEEVNTIYEQAEVLVHDSWVGNGTVGLMFPITLYKMFEAKLKEKNT